MKIDLGKIFLRASLDSRNDPRRFSAQQVPGFLVGVVFRAGHGRIQAHSRHATHHFFGKDVPDVFRNYVGGYEIERVFLIDMVAVFDRAVVAIAILINSGFHLNPDDPCAPIVHKKVVPPRFPKGSGWP